jgi:hypothetical protein
MRLAISILALTASTTATAGGLGVIVNGGFHSEDVYFYSDSVSVLNDDGSLADGGFGGTQIKYQSLGDYEQYKNSQLLGDVGAGFELILGDRDGKFFGTFRGYWSLETSQRDPSLTLGLDDTEQTHLVAEWREGFRHVGIGLVGITWLPIGDTSGFAAGPAAHLGAGFLTSDHTEFLIGQLGMTATYRTSRSTQLWADVNGVFRFRKVGSGGFAVNAGFRYLFD